MLADFTGLIAPWEPGNFRLAGKPEVMDTRFSRFWSSWSGLFLVSYLFATRVINPIPAASTITPDFVS
jgi:hypothetical protein